jgi:hypothetical protein
MYGVPEETTLRILFFTLQFCTTNNFFRFIYDIVSALDNITSNYKMIRE